MARPFASDAVATLLEALFDDAAIFPPGNAPMAGAVPGHDRHRTAWYAPLVGPFLCAAARVGELRAALARRPGGSPPLEVALVVRGAPAARPAVEFVLAEERAVLAGVEVAPAYGAAAGGPGAGEVARDALATLAGSVPPGVPVALEVARGDGCEPVLDVLVGEGRSGRRPRAKLRTGGEDAAAFPSTAEVAAFVHGCARRGLAFKCTAGLHHALRHTAPDTGFEHHGYLNVLLAAAAAARGGTAADLEAVLAERGAGALARRVRELDEPAAAAARGLFASFGTCSVEEPVGDAVELGLLRGP